MAVVVDPILDQFGDFGAVFAVLSIHAFLCVNARRDTHLLSKSSIPPLAYSPHMHSFQSGHRKRHNLLLMV